jgi:ketosteroid isomerase-like protein
MSKAEENAEVVRRGYAAFNAADIKTLTELMPENASWHTPGRSRVAGDHQGRDAVFAQCGRYGGETNEVKNGQMVSGREHFFDLHNWDAFWA